MNLENDMPDLNDQKPQIDYPCPWEYKIIGTDEDAVRSAVKICLDETLNRDSGDRPYELGFTRSSEQGKYVSLSLNIEVQDEQERKALFQRLAARPEINMVI